MPLVGIVLAMIIILVLISWLVNRSRERDISDLFNSRELKRAGLVIIALSIGIVILLAIYRLYHFEENICREMKNNLQTVLKTSHQTLKVWTEGHHNELRMILGSSEFKTYVNDLIQTPRRKPSLSTAPSQKRLKTFFLNNHNHFENLQYYVLSPDMTIIGATNEHLLGSHLVLPAQRQEQLNRVYLNEQVMILPFFSTSLLARNKQETSRGKPVMLFAGPVTDASGLVRAVIAIAVVIF